MKRIIPFLLILASCGAVENESKTDDNFVGVWKVQAASPEPDADIRDMVIGNTATINKVPNTKEAYSFAYAGEVTMFVKKDDNTLVDDEGLKATLKFDANKNNLLCSTEGKETILDFRKVK